MNSWKIIRQECVKDEEEGSSGYCIGLVKATDIFLFLRGYLIDWDKASIDFHKDGDVAIALTKLRKPGIRT